MAASAAAGDAAASGAARNDAAVQAAPHTFDTSTPTPTPTDTPTPTMTPTPTVECVNPPDIYEPDDTKSQAGHLHVNDPAQSHTLHRASDVDWYRFDGLAANRSYNVSTANLTGGADTYIILYDQNNNIVRTNDDIDTAWCQADPPQLQYCASSIRWTATSSGPYFLKVFTLTYAPQDPACVCPGYDIRLKSFASYLPLIIKSPRQQPTPTPTATATLTVTPTATQPPELPTEIPLPAGPVPEWRRRQPGHAHGLCHQPR